MHFGSFFVICKCRLNQEKEQTFEMLLTKSNMRSMLASEKRHEKAIYYASNVTDPWPDRFSCVQKNLISREVSPVNGEEYTISMKLNTVWRAVEYEKL